MKIWKTLLPLSHRPVLLCSAVLALLSTTTIGAFAQSIDIGFPTPIRANDISGVITPRDLGDARQTRYFYSFTGTPGDLIVSVEANNLDGEVDVFTAGALRPLAKLSLYAGGTSSGGTQTIYLRARQSLILRVQARTPNDTEGTFRVRFSGGFEPIGSEIPDPETVTPTISSSPKGKRVTSTGARIAEPEPEATGTKTEVAMPAPNTPSGETPPSRETREATAEATKPESPKSRVPSIRRPRPRSTRNRPPPTARRTTPPLEPSRPQPNVEPPSGPRLIIELKDGVRVERYMTTVRRLTVERGQVVVVTTDGKVDRQPMTNVLRVAIEP